MGVALLPALTAASSTDRSPWTFLPLAVSVAVLTLGTVVVFPFETDTIAALAGNRFIATHYGLHNTICGVGIGVGNLATGAALDLAREFGVPWAPWLAFVLIGVASAWGVHVLSILGRIVDKPVSLPYCDRGPRLSTPEGAP